MRSKSHCKIDDAKDHKTLRKDKKNDDVKDHTITTLIKDKKIDDDISMSLYSIQAGSIGVPTIMLINGQPVLVNTR